MYSIEKHFTSPPSKRKKPSLKRYLKKLQVSDEFKGEEVRGTLSASYNPGICRTSTINKNQKNMQNGLTVLHYCHHFHQYRKQTSSNNYPIIWKPLNRTDVTVNNTSGAVCCLSLWDSKIDKGSVVPIKRKMWSFVKIDPQQMSHVINHKYQDQYHTTLTKP